MKSDQFNQSTQLCVGLHVYHITFAALSCFLKVKTSFTKRRKQLPASTGQFKD